MNDQISNQRLAPMHPAVIARANLAANRLAMKGIYYRVIEGARSFAESDADYAQSRTVPGPRITNAPAGYSWHNFNMAIDAAPFLVGTSGAINWIAGSRQYIALIEELTNAGLPLRGGCK